MFYDIFKQLAHGKGISVQKAANAIGFSNSIATKWKKTSAVPDGVTLRKIADYFDVTVDYLLGRETQKATQNIELNDFQVALYDATADLNDPEIQAELIKHAQRLAEYAKLKGDKGNG